MHSVPTAVGARSSTFDRIVAPHVGRMLARSKRLLKSEDVAWDVVQDTLAQVARDARLQDDAGGVLAHLVGLRALARLRADRRRTVHEQCACALCRESSEHDDPAATAIAHETKHRVDAALARLPASARDAMLLRHRDDLPYDEIARRLDIPLGTVRSRLARARDLMRAALEDRCSLAS
ncbi:MAG: sigma-70 family RNA polymerase sigma factor [Planctomycetes bacterium]|nr:sigma-70 family RNA polymerase sigma factor [Planctomycetota bacterium]MCC7173019.1 sigma-70 family RNA polymerase sigma factor [Planctomycetota bacterium]